MARCPIRHQAIHYAVLFYLSLQVTQRFTLDHVVPTE
jgi:hypothetical protein